MATIPRVVHCIWIQGEAALEASRDWWPKHRAAWAALMPRWKVRIWEDATIRPLLREHYPKLLRLYDAPGAPMAWKADVARYALVHRHGGMYADITYEVLRNFDWILAGKGVDMVYVMHDVTATERELFAPVNNCWFAATPQHEVLARVIDALGDARVPRTFDGNTVTNTTGPHALWRGLRPLVSQPNLRAIPALALDPFVASGSYVACDSADDCRARLPATVALHRSQQSYQTGFEKLAYGGIIFVKRNYISCTLVFLLLLVIVGLSLALWGRHHRLARRACEATCPVATARRA